MLTTAAASNWTVSDVATLLAAIGGWLAAGISFFKARGDRLTGNAATEVSFGGVARGLLADVASLSERLKESEAHRDTCTKEMAAAAIREAALFARVARLEAALPLALAADRLEDLASIGYVFDQLADPLIITSAAKDGMIVWCNAAFAAALQLTREKVIATGWKELIYPPDLEDTSVIEATAWDVPVEGFVNRYKRADGTLVRLRWYAAPYRAGVTLAIARVMVPSEEK